MYTEYLFICPVPASPSSLGTAKTQSKNIEIFTDVQILIPSNKDLLKKVSRFDKSRIKLRWNTGLLEVIELETKGLFA